MYGALPEDSRGAFLTPAGPVAGRIRELGFVPVARSEELRPILVAAYGDLGHAVLLRRKRIAIMEHGIGQSYGGRPLLKDGSYAGGRGRGPASLFLHPGEHPAARDRAAYPQARVDVVGAPILDTLPAREGPPGRVVAFSFHFNSSVVPETKYAFPWIFLEILKLRDRFELLGHAHPSVFEKLRRSYRAAGIEDVRHFADICRRADVYVCDNSSTLYAFAVTGRPVVVLNPPWYDKSINHGLRFWEAASVGIQVNKPGNLGDAIEEALRDRPAQRKRREAALDLVYGYRTGAAQRAATILQEWAA